MDRIDTLIRAEAPLAVVVVTLGGGAPHLAVAPPRRGARLVGVAQEGKGEGAGASFSVPTHCGQGWRDKHDNEVIGSLMETRGRE